LAPPTPPPTQGLTLPNGMQPFPYGPICGSNHDSFMLRTSQLVPVLHHLSQTLGTIFAAYGDLAYPNDPCLVRPTSGATSWERDFDRTMSSMRISNEWGFGKLFTLWAYLDYRHAHKVSAHFAPMCVGRQCYVCSLGWVTLGILQVLLSPVGLLYPVANILTNCHTCLYGSQTGSYFMLFPPRLEDYLSGRML
jgi:hypothetical protein